MGELGAMFVIFVVIVGILYIGGAIFNAMGNIGLLIVLLFPIIIGLIIKLAKTIDEKERKQRESKITPPKKYKNFDWDY